LTVHRWFANKSCPGDWLYSRLGNVAKEVTKALNTSIKSKENITKKKSIDTIAREVINGKWGNGTARKSKLTKAGYDYNAVQKRVNQLLA
ncbi:MAG: N-acetylmuramoyl-L-alanine amidase, partial [Ruminococcus sp.]